MAKLSKLSKRLNRKAWWTMNKRELKRAIVAIDKAILASIESSRLLHQAQSNHYAAVVSVAGRRKALAKMIGEKSVAYRGRLYSVEDGELVVSPVVEIKE